jgi:colicin import membrane protein
LKVDKSLVASVGLHVLVIGWGLISFASRAFDSAEVESIPIEFVTSDQLSKITAGTKTGAKENPKPLVEKVADAKPVDNNIGKITEKQPIVTDAGSDPTPVEKPTEKKPDPSKPVAESKPKDEAKPVEKKPDPSKVDPIAEALKKEEAKKPVAKPQQAKAAPPPPVKKHEYKFSAESIAAQLDKRDPTRQAFAGAELNASASLGTSRGTAVTLSQSELDAMRARLASLWNVQPGEEHPEELFVTVRIRLNPDRRLAEPPQIISTGSSPRYQAAADAAVRAVLQGQPYTMLHAETYDAWKYMDIDFDPKQMFHSS